MGRLRLTGKHKLHVGDATSSDAVSRLFSGERASLCFTSPPYANQREYNGAKDLSTEHLATFIRAAYGSVDLFAVNLGLSRKDGEVQQYWDDYIAEAKGCGLKLLSWNVWDRQEATSVFHQTAMFAISHEWILVFGDAPQELNATVPNKRAGCDPGGRSVREPDGQLRKMSTARVRDMSQLKTVWTSPAEKDRSHGIDHPAMFPVALPAAYIEACTDPGEIVYEPFCGSGTTIVACEKLGRRCFATDVDPAYCSTAIARWERFSGRQAVLETVSEEVGA